MRPLEHEILDETVVEEHKDHQWLDMIEMLRRIRDCVLVIMDDSVVERENAK